MSGFHCSIAIAAAMVSCARDAAEPPNVMDETPVRATAEWTDLVAYDATTRCSDCDFTFETDDGVELDPIGAATFVDSDFLPPPVYGHAGFYQSVYDTADTGGESYDPPPPPQLGGSTVY